MSTLCESAKVAKFDGVLTRKHTKGQFLHFTDPLPDYYRFDIENRSKM